MAFKMKGFSGFKQTQNQRRIRTTKDIMSPAGFEAVKRRQIKDSYNEPGGSPREYQIRKRNERQRRGFYTPVDPHTGIPNMNTVRKKVDYTKKFY
jgi:hypothetical protein|tara:strand:+ start:52 stop:336 length:285 start_codon:yes stop_codon:yes gene_type:complete